MRTYAAANSLDLYMSLKIIRGLGSKQHQTPDLHVDMSILTAMNWWTIANTGLSIVYVCTLDAMQEQNREMIII